VSGKVLVVTYYFPPLGGVGVQRTLKYITYLPRWGWRPIVVTPGNPAYAVRDASLLDALPADLEVHRTTSWEPGRWLGAVARRLGTGGAGRTVSKLRSASDRVWGALLFPDNQVGWAPFGARAGRKASRGTGFDVVYSTAAPISAHLIAGMVKRSTGRP
jgi:hypothetical protein